MSDTGASMSKTHSSSRRIVLDGVLFMDAIPCLGGGWKVMVGRENSYIESLGVIDERGRKVPDLCP